MPDDEEQGGQRARDPQQAKVWSGRLSGGTDPVVERYMQSFDSDWRLLPDDIRATRAHVTMLGAIGVLSDEERQEVDAALVSVAREVEDGTFALAPGDEDIHTALERRITELAGAAGAKVHTGRSRNDQVLTALRLYVRRDCSALAGDLITLQEALLERAADHVDTAMPGYTHLQRAQPLTLAHHLLAYVEMFARDVGRVLDARTRADVLPLGSGALAGSTLPLRREDVRDTLGFARISANSLDAVADRDFAAEICAACAITMAHCSRIGEEIVLWTTSEFGFAQLDDAHATGSSLMPQKKNPDVAELARGRTGSVTGALVALLTMLKGLPLSYNRDLQEDKRQLFTALDVTRETLRVLAVVLRGLQFDTTAMRAAASDPALLATDVAEHLVLHGVPFREAHRAVGAVVRRALAQGRPLSAVTLEEWRGECPAADEDVLQLFDVEAALRRRELPGGPGPEAVRTQLDRARRDVAAARQRLAELE